MKRGKLKTTREPKGKTYSWLRLSPSDFDGPMFSLATAEAQGVLFSLLLHAWRNQGAGLPDDDMQLARLCRFDPDSITRARPLIGEYFERDLNGLLRAPMLEAQLRIARDLTKKHKAAKEKPANPQKSQDDTHNFDTTETQLGPRDGTERNGDGKIKTKTTDSETPFPSPAPTPASMNRPVKIETKFDSNGRPSVSVPEAVCLIANTPEAEPEKHNKPESWTADVQSMFENSFPGISWEANRKSVLAQCIKFGRARFNRFCVDVRERIEKGEAIANPVGYVMRCMEKDSANNVVSS